jgi:acetyl-CoA carboxylase biotin carboxyl carrier protein
MDLDEVRELVKLVEDSGIEELEISHEGTTIRIQKSRTFVPAAAAVAPQPMPVAMTAPPMSPSSAPAPAPAEGAAATREASPVPERDKWKEIRSPIVGTYYRAPSPEAEPFVRVGDRISPGQTLCIVEAMKVMNEIEAEFAGVIKEILVENAQPIEAEAVLFLVEPA